MSARTMVWNSRCHRWSGSNTVPRQVQMQTAQLWMHTHAFFWKNLCEMIWQTKCMIITYMYVHIMLIIFFLKILYDIWFSPRRYMPYVHHRFWSKAQQSSSGDRGLFGGGVLCLHLSTILIIFEWKMLIFIIFVRLHAKPVSKISLPKDLLPSIFCWKTFSLDPNKDFFEFHCPEIFPECYFHHSLEPKERNVCNAWKYSMPTPKQGFIAQSLWMMDGGCQGQVWESRKQNWWLWRVPPSSYFSQWCQHFRSIISLCFPTTGLSDWPFGDIMLTLKVGEFIIWGVLLGQNFGSQKSTQKCLNKPEGHIFLAFFGGLFRNMGVVFWCFDIFCTNFIHFCDFATFALISPPCFLCLRAQRGRRGGGYYHPPLFDPPIFGTLGLPEPQGGAK